MNSTFTMVITIAIEITTGITRTRRAVLGIIFPASGIQERSGIRAGVVIKTETNAMTMTIKEVTRTGGAMTGTRTYGKRRVCLN